MIEVSKPVYPIIVVLIISAVEKTADSSIRWLVEARQGRR